MVNVSYAPTPPIKPRDFAQEIANATAVSKEFEGAIAAVVDRVAAAMSLRVIKLGEDYLAASKKRVDELPIVQEQASAFDTARDKKELELYQMLTGAVTVLVPDALRDVLKAADIDEASIREAVLPSLSVLARTKSMSESDIQTRDNVVAKQYELIDGELVARKAFVNQGSNCIPQDDWCTTIFHYERQKRALAWLALAPDQRPAYNEVPGEREFRKGWYPPPDRSLSEEVLLLALKKRLAAS